MPPLLYNPQELVYGEATSKEVIELMSTVRKNIL
jgi:hypothetical protein